MQPDRLGAAHGVSAAAGGCPLLGINLFWVVSRAQAVLETFATYKRPHQTLLRCSYLSHDYIIDGAICSRLKCLTCPSDARGSASTRPATIGFPLIPVRMASGGLDGNAAAAKIAEVLEPTARLSSTGNRQRKGKEEQTDHDCWCRHPILWFTRPTAPSTVLEVLAEAADRQTTQATPS